MAYKERQPKGLINLFFTEMWERFGYYTVQTIIILYLTKALLFSEHKANLLYAAYSALLYITPAIGGYLADHYLGFRRAIILGGLMLLSGYVFLSFPQVHLFYLGLAILICGNGFLKPNVSSIVGDLYGKNDPRREGGFTLFYMGINLGSLIPPLITGGIIAWWGWHAGFSLAALGMLLSMVVYMFFGKSVRQMGLAPRSSPASKQGRQKVNFYIKLYAAIALAVACCYVAMLFPEGTDVVVEVAAVLVIFLVGFYLFREPVVSRNKMLAALLLIVLSIGFWALYIQTFTSLMFLAEHNMNPHLGFIHVTPELTQFFNPFFIIALSPVLSRLWVRLDKSDKNPGIPLKFSMAIVFMCLGFLMLAFGTSFVGDHGKISVWWLIASYFLQTIGELLLSPIGLAMITVLCPKHLVGMMMGVWFFALAGAFAVGGMLANVAALPKHVGVMQSLAIYHNAFTDFSYLSIALVAVSFISLPFMNRMIKGGSKSS